MDTNTAVVLVMGLLALVAGVFFLVYRGRARADFKGPFGIGGSLDGGNDPPRRPGRIEAGGATAGRDLRAVSHTGGDIGAEGATAGRDLHLEIDPEREDPRPNP